MGSDGYDLERRVIRKVGWRLLPFMFLLYIVAYLDRINVGFAALQMNQELGFDAEVYGFGAGVFFVGYFLFEIPSNLILERVGPRLWIARIMLSWGLVAGAMALVKTPTAFYLLRFLLGLAEAGFFPGMILYLTYWFPAAQRARAVAWFMTATAIAGVIGGPISGALLELHGLGGLRGWQWLFLLEAAPAVVLGVVVWQRLIDRPEHAAWLLPEERDWLVGRLAEESAARDRLGSYSLREALLAPRVWRLAMVYLALVVGIYGVGMWLPQVVKDLLGGATAGDFKVGMVSAVPYLAAAVGMVLVGRYSDRHDAARRLHVAGSLLAGVIGLLACAWLKGPVVVLAALALAAVGIWGALGPFWSLSTGFLNGTAAAGGIALINSVGNLGGFAGPYLVGVLKQASGGYSLPFLALAGLVLLGAGLVAGVRTGVHALRL